MVKAARRASQVINRASNDIEHLKITTKQHNDFVTEVDRTAEAAIIDVLREAYPEYSILAEESGRAAGTDTESEYQWIIDPLDGTTNFLHGIPQFAVSIALERNGEIVAGVIFNPATDELYTSEKGGGAFLNDRRIRVAARKVLSDSAAGKGFDKAALCVADALPMGSKTGTVKVPMRFPGGA